MTDEVRLERLRPAGLEAALARAPIAWIPLGAIEFHAPHLPFGTDGFTGHGLLERAARRAGGVVLPWSYLTIGTLHFPWTFRYDPAIVAASVLGTLRQAASFGARVAVVHTGHAPLDLVHLLKRTCAEAETAIGGGFRAYGLTYLELNAALGVGLGTDWPVAVDHGATLETSWMLALEPELVALDTLPARTTASRSSACTGRTRGPAPTPTGVATRSRRPRSCWPDARSTCSAGGRSTRSPTCAGSWSATGPSRCASARWPAGPRRAARRSPTTDPSRAT